jgi:hypothetical protein
MLNKISEAQRSMLRAAATRDDRLVTPPAKLRTAAVKSLAGKLLDAGWVSELKARSGMPVWRKDVAGDASYAMKLTAKGLEAAAAIEAPDGEGAPAGLPDAKKAAVSAPAKGAEAAVKEVAPATEINADLHSPIRTRPPRPSSKLGRVLDMLAADAGATIDKLTAATSWLEHTTRSALTGLRHRGYALSLARKERSGASVYRIVPPGGEAAQ